MRSVRIVEASPDTLVYPGLIDWMFLFGLDIAVVGWLAIALELVHGTGFDLYYATRG